MKLRRIKKELKKELNDIPEIYDSIKIQVTEKAIENSNRKTKTHSFSALRTSLISIGALVVICIGVLFGNKIYIQDYNSKVEKYNSELIAQMNADKLSKRYQLNHISSKDDLDNILESTSTNLALKTKKEDFISQIVDLFGSTKKTDAAVGSNVISQVTSSATYTTAESAPSSSTVTQTEGIDELDIIKANNNHIFYICDFTLTSYKTDDNMTLENVFSINQYEEINYSGKGLYLTKYTYDSGIFLTDTEVVIIANSEYTNKSVIYFLNQETFAVTKRLEFSTYIFESRLTDDYLYLVTRKSFINSDDIENLYKEDNEYVSNDFQKMYCLNNNIGKYDVSIMSIDLETKEIYTEQIIGNFVNLTVYMSTNALYVLSFNYYLNGTDYNESTIYRFKLANSLLKFEQCGIVIGNTLNQYSVDEYNNKLRIVTTSYTTTEDKNKVFVLDLSTPEDEQMEIVGSLLTGIGLTSHEVKSVTFDGLYVDIVTYYTADPLYKIYFGDDEISPKIIDTYAAPGYSGFLYRFVLNDTDYILGIGINDDRNKWKLSLYDSSNGETNEQIGSDLLGAYSDSEAIYYGMVNQKALFIYQKEDCLLLGFGYNYDGSENIFKYDIFKVTEEGITLYAEITDSLLEYERKGRMVYVNDKYYFISESIYTFVGTDDGTTINFNLTNME